MAKKASAAMMDYCSEPQFSSQEIDHILRALSVRDADAIPVLAATTGENGKSKMVFASRTMLTLFRVDDLATLSAKFFEGDEPGAKRAATLAASLAQDGAPRLERLRFSLGPRPETITFLCRKISGAENSTFLVAAALGVRAWLLNAADSGLETSNSEQEPETAPILSIEEVRDALAARLGARTTIRFLWRTDAEDKITEITPPLAEVVGAAAADLLGRDFGDVAKYLESEPDGQLSRAFAKRETFSGIEVLWPVASAAAAVPVGLGGLPAFDRERRFDGYRGFGVIHVARLAGAEPRPLFGQISEGAIPEPPRASNVVRLPLPHPPAPKPVEDILSSDSRDNSLLSFDEHTAFREIAQVLAEEAANTVADRAEDRAEALQRKPEVEGVDALKAANEARNMIAILDRIGLGVLVSRDDVAIYANRPLLDLLGFADEDAFHAAGGMGRLFEQRNNGESIGLRTAAGEVITRRARIQSIEWDGLPATLLTLRRDDEPDDSGRLEDELRVQKAEARELNAILDTATDGLAVLDSQGRIVTLSRSAEALFGFDQSEVAGKPLTVLIAAESQDKVRDYFESLRGHGVASLLNDGREIVGHAHQGGLIPIFMTLGRIGHAQSDPVEQRFCALFRDMTHWKKVEQELKEARLEAERASALKSDFLAKVSHEIRTPLNAILGFAEVIMEERFGPIGNERYRDYLKDIHTSGTHVMSLVNDLLDLSKIEAGKMDMSFVSVDLNRAISEAVAIMQPQANQERIIMRLALAPHLPRIVADERSLRQILLNLLSNAVKFNEPGGQVIVATALTDGGNAVIRIRDTGIGMSDEDIETALEPFRQLATARQTSGTGLGLPLTKALVEANRAFFTIKSKKNEGTMVEIAFPSARVLAE